MASKMIKLYDKNGSWCQPMVNHLVSSGDIGSGADFNNYLSQGEFQVGYTDEGTPPINGPYKGRIYGKLFVEVDRNNTHNNSDNWLWQIFIDTSERIYKRQKINDGPFTPWREIGTSIALYDNASGTTGTVTLSQSAANFNYLEIHFNINGSRYLHTKVLYPDGKTIALNGFWGAPLDGNLIQFETRDYTINGTSIIPTYDYEIYSNIASGTTVHIDRQLRITINKVIGYN